MTTESFIVKEETDAARLTEPMLFIAGLGPAAEPSAACALGLSANHWIDFYRNRVVHRSGVAWILYTAATHRAALSNYSLLIFGANCLDLMDKQGKKRASLAELD